MNYLKVMEKLYEENQGYIVLMRCGIFYSAVGYNALKLAELFDLKLICMTEGLCRCSIPTAAIEKYIFKFQRSNYSYLIYDYKKEGFEDTGLNYKLLCRIDGKLNEIEDENMGCYQCEYYKQQKLKTLNKTMYELEMILKEENKKHE